MPVKTVIVVENGMVIVVYSTIPADSHEIELLDLDNAKQESPKTKDEMETHIDEVSKSSEYQEIF